jgi:hypothetical protein
MKRCIASGSRANRDLCTQSAHLSGTSGLLRSVSGSLLWPHLKQKCSPHRQCMLEQPLSRSMSWWHDGQGLVCAWAHAACCGSASSSLVLPATSAVSSSRNLAATAASARRSTSAGDSRRVHPIAGHFTALLPLPTSLLIHEARQARQKTCGPSHGTSRKFSLWRGSRDGSVAIASEQISHVVGGGGGDTCDVCDLKTCAIVALRRGATADSCDVKECAWCSAKDPPA